MAARTDLRIDILEGISEPDLDRYAKVSIQFTSAEKYEVREREGGGFALGLCALPESISTDFDAHEHPTEWVRWDLRNAAMFEAHLGGRLVGGAVVVRDMPKLNLLAARKDLAVLWDLRVAPEFRRQKIGASLLREASRWARKRRCRSIKVESQNDNVRACDFYRKHGFRLAQAEQGVYRAFPDKVQLIWERDL